jgi:hypothetical protein
MTDSPTVGVIARIVKSYVCDDPKPCDNCATLLAQEILRTCRGMNVIGHYSDALDEIYELRAALAYEARILEMHLAFKTFPKSRRRMAEQQIDRMRGAVSGPAGRPGVYLAHPSRFTELRRLGVKGFTMAEWESRSGS